MNPMVTVQYNVLVEDLEECLTRLRRRLPSRASQDAKFYKKAADAMVVSAITLIKQAERTHSKRTSGRSSAGGHGLPFSPRRSIRSGRKSQS